MKSTSILAVGSVCVYRPPGKPNWTMKLRWPGQKDTVRATLCALCPACLAVPARPQSVRPGCPCRKPAQAEADAWLADEREQAKSVMRGGQRLHVAADLLRQRRTFSYVTYGDVFAAYSANASPSMQKTVEVNINSAKLILRQITGQSNEQVCQLRTTEPTAAQLRDWMRMRQAFAAGTETDWTELRRRVQLPSTAGGLPALEINLPCPGNASINSAIANARSIFCKKSRNHILHGLSLPESTSWDAVSALPATTGYEGRSSQEKAAVHQMALSWWQHGGEVEREAALMYWLLLITGARPVELRKADASWLSQQEGVTWLTIKNKPTEGLFLKAKTLAVRRDIPLVGLPEDVLAVILSRQGLLIAPDWSQNKRMSLTERWMSDRIGALLPGTNAPVYEIRKWKTSAVRRLFGDDVAASAAGHSQTATMARHYGAAIPIPAISVQDILCADSVSV